MTWILPEHFHFSCLERICILAKDIKKKSGLIHYTYVMHSEQAKTSKIEVTVHEQ